MLLWRFIRKFSLFFRTDRILRAILENWITTRATQFLSKKKKKNQEKKNGTSQDGAEQKSGKINSEKKREN